MSTKPTGYRELELEVIRWAEARKIIPNSTPLAQTRKTLEESGELLEAAAKLQALKRIAQLVPGLQHNPLFVAYMAEVMDEFKDAVGDVYVTVINACALADVDAVSCLADAYDQIKDRRGTLMPNGIFVKEA